jgi:hypothetical protein
MSAASCPAPEELQHLIEERLGPVREAEIEAHVEACPLCQDRLERLTAPSGAGQGRSGHARGDRAGWPDC